MQMWGSEAASVLLGHRLANTVAERHYIARDTDEVLDPRPLFDPKPDGAVTPRPWRIDRE